MGEPAFVRALARTAAEWDFAAAAPVPVVALESIVEAHQEIQLHVGSGLFGETPLMDLVTLSLLVAQASPGVLFEFGTFTGLATLHMALNAPGGVVHTLDLGPVEPGQISAPDWEPTIEPSSVGAMYRAESGVTQRVRQHWGDSRHFDTAPLRGTVGFVFIDAAHSYDFVSSDTEKALQLAAPGATVVWHDYSRACPDVQRVVAEQVPRYSPIAVAGTSIAVMRLP